MSVKRRSGLPKLKAVPNKISEVFVAGELVTNDSGNGFTASTSSSTNIKGITVGAISATDDEYTTQGTIVIDEINPDDVFEMPVTGTFTAANVGDFLDLSDAVTVNADASAVDAVECVGYINSTLGLFKINANAASKGAVGSTS